MISKNGAIIINIFETPTISVLNILNHELVGTAIKFSNIIKPNSTMINILPPHKSISEQIFKYFIIPSTYN